MTAHEWMLDIVKAAEELGYGIRYVSRNEIGVIRPEGNGFFDIDIKGVFVNGDLLRRTLVAVKGESK